MRDLWPEGKDGISCLQDVLGTEEPGLVYPGNPQVSKEPSASSRSVRLENRKRGLAKRQRQRQRVLALS